ncbi:metal-dependent phosphohydrolase [Paraflavitalea soli]|uniref:Metal-dependent phosphohydrolase n=1 Tax=Paraflavitalea soli TaxID=2315862 RepID=A0A3B7MVK4_9BACT|nr:HD domain-containing protein [Paraflavitalea soli]AXY77967.1 metal-dependent phosphohydrolase [Paraflavitalea soli]
MDTRALLNEIKVHVEELFREHQQPWLLYHNLAHTQKVVHHTEVIATRYLLNDRKYFIVVAAAWFHDTGHLLGELALHEEVGVRLMQEFLTSKNMDQPTLDDITKCILATKMPVHPASVEEQILCDADTWHVGTEDFWIKDELVWLEMESRLHKHFDNRVALSLHFMEAHTFFTPYCQQLLNEGKTRNIRQLKKMLEK